MKQNQVGLFNVSGEGSRARKNQERVCACKFGHAINQYER